MRTDKELLARQQEINEQIKSLKTSSKEYFELSNELMRIHFNLEKQSTIHILLYDAPEFDISSHDSVLQK